MLNESHKVENETVAVQNNQAMSAYRTVKLNLHMCCAMESRRLVSFTIQLFYFSCL
jgi:hypothetical protein